MKKIIFKLLIFSNILLFAKFSYTQSGWIKQYLGNSTIVTIHFFNQNTGLAANYDGTLYKSTNGGINWISSSDVYKIYSGYYFDESNFVLVGEDIHYWGWVGIYINGIRTDYILYPTNLAFLYFSTTDWINENTGYVAGSNWDMVGYTGKVVKTTNKGLNWTDATPTPSLFVNDIKFINSNTGYILDPYAKKTTNAGNNWVLCQSYSIGGNSIAIANPDTMFIVGSYGTIYFSSNSGTNWISRSIGSSASLDCVNFFNGKTGWICGTGGLVMRTTNAGINWNSQVSGTLVRLRTIQILNMNNLWIAGDSGVILHTTTGGLTFTKEYTKEIPLTFILKQNYPNPFNPVTKIEFDVSRTEFIVLRIFDVQGKEISTLVNEKLNPGKYSVDWNASAFPSGVYFYRLFTNSFSETKKMLLVK